MLQLSKDFKDLLEKIFLNSQGSARFRLLNLVFNEWGREYAVHILTSFWDLCVQRIHVSVLLILEVILDYSSWFICLSFINTKLNYSLII